MYSTIDATLLESSKLDEAQDSFRRTSKKSGFTGTSPFKQSNPIMNLNNTSGITLLNNASKAGPVRTSGRDYDSVDFRSGPISIRNEEPKLKTFSAHQRSAGLKMGGDNTLSHIPHR